MKYAELMLSLGLLFSLSSLSAETVRIRSGEILSAEIGKNAPSVAGADADAFPGLPSDPVYAVVALRLDPLRSLSIFDYSLGGYGRKFPCIAIEREGRFEYTTENVTSAGVQRLLFVLDGKQFALKEKEELILFCNFPPHDGSYDTPTVFRNIRQSAFTPPARIPADGMMEKAAR